MINEKTIAPKELTDDQLNEVAGGAGVPQVASTCFLCKNTYQLSDLKDVKINGVSRKVCVYCFNKTDAEGKATILAGQLNSKQMNQQMNKQMNQQMKGLEK